jgi:hypothetical protein
MILSDGSLCLPPHYKNAYLKIEQKDKDLVFHLYDLFKPLGIVGPREEW